MRQKGENGKNVSISMAIIRTIAFFDLFDYPLTAWEIWQYGMFPNKMEFSEVFSELNNVNLLQNISQKQGFYFLSGREDLVEIRKTRYSMADRKTKRAIKITRLIKKIPWVEMAAVSNIIGSHNMKDESDIDLFVVASDGRVWLTRFCCVVLTKILGLRPSKSRTRDTICLNFYVCQSAADLKPLTLSDDPYFIYWLASLIPIYGRNNAYQKFIAANQWLYEFLPNWQPQELTGRRQINNATSGRWIGLAGFLFGWLEKPLENFQLRILPMELKSKMNLSTDVVVNNQIIKLHSRDRRLEYLKKFNAFFHVET